jgi:hypothetical protein
MGGWVGGGIGLFKYKIKDLGVFKELNEMVIWPMSKRWMAMYCFSISLVNKPILG